MNKVYHTIGEAKFACQQYQSELERLAEKFGVWEENDDSCSETRIYAMYMGADGKEKKYCHN